MVIIHLMKLQDYRQQNGISPTQLAELLAVSPMAVSRYERGQRIPEPPVMQRIAEATGGAVTANDFYGITETCRSEPSAS
jgi:transcriptional regulator with XRE-family HTH domain